LKDRIKNIYTTNIIDKPAFNRNNSLYTSVKSIRQVFYTVFAIFCIINTHFESYMQKKTLLVIGGCALGLLQSPSKIRPNAENFMKFPTFSRVFYALYLPSQLQVLDLSCNKLESLQGIHLSPKLQELDLSYN
jgi:Leucine-rich repeat (LRR) protein